MIPRESRTIFSANLATSLMSTPSSSRKLLVLFGIVPRDPNQRPLTVNSLSLRRSHGISLLGKGYIYRTCSSFPFPLHQPDRGNCSQSGQLDPRSALSFLSWERRRYQRIS
ncbi:unnamed protein product [Nezara viridula]|uniref:Uncharacterized protein n=1 Tax=Nezara viridula TaxID=85310 RepID=A0A9P0MWX9_NEZVI|nr:unnamed protein product [Nezara viridula]